jgi:hypothetical protein
LRWTSSACILILMNNANKTETKIVKIVPACKYCEAELTGSEIRNGMRRCFDCIKAGAFHGI